MRLLHEIAIFQTVKSKVIISLFETVRLSVSISLRNLYNSLNSIKENTVSKQCLLWAPFAYDPFAGFHVRMGQRLRQKNLAANKFSKIFDKLDLLEAKNTHNKWKKAESV